MLTFQKSLILVSINTLLKFECQLIFYLFLLIFLPRSDAFHIFLAVANKRPLRFSLTAQATRLPWGSPLNWVARTALTLHTLTGWTGISDSPSLAEEFDWSPTLGTGFPASSIDLYPVTLPTYLLHPFFK